MEFSYKPAEPNGGHRKAFRTTFPGLSVRVNDNQTAYPVHDISSGGVAFSDAGETFAKGAQCTITLCIGERAYLADLPAQVVRVRPPECGCNFLPLNRRQEIALDKLILETQKRIIAQIRQARECQAASEECPDSPDAKISDLRLNDLHIEEF